MSCDWSLSTVGEVSLKITKGTTPTSIGGNFTATGINFIKVESLTQEGTFIGEKFAHIDESTDSKLTRSRLEKNDVLFTIAGTIGRVALVPPWILPANTNQAVAIIRPNQEKINPRYLLYVLSDKERIKHALTRVVQSVQANFSLSELAELTIPLPPLAEQERIASILGALDDKIELNSKMNETLEQITKAQFKSWFIDFDPVHAKATGRQPAGMDRATADLFPDSFVDSELGKIPGGWKAGCLSNLSEFSRESINPGESPSEIFDHYSLPSFDEGKAPKAEAGSEIKSNKLVVTKTCVLLSKLNPHIPRIWLPNLHASRRSICSTEFIVASAMEGCTREYLYALFISEYFSRTYGTLVTGTTGSHQRIRAESVLQMRLPIAPAKLISSFTNTIAPMLNRVASNNKESQTLAELRDTLLPQLLNGDLKVA